MTILEFGAMLTQSELEGHLTAQRFYVDAERCSSPDTQPRLMLDLSRVEYADFVALAQIALLVEGAARCGTPVQVATPLRRMSTGERNALESPPEGTSLARHQTTEFIARVTRRKQSYAFMSRCGFIDALKPKHVPNIDALVHLLFNYDNPESTKTRDIEYSDLGIEGVKRTIDQTVITNARDVVPLRWLNREDLGPAHAWESEIATILALRAPVLTTHDVDAIVTIVLRELVDNVMSHASAQMLGTGCGAAALLGAAAVIGGEGGSSPVGDRRLLARYTSWLNERQATVIRLIVGDSGRGICSALEPPPTTAGHVDLPDLGRRLEQSERSLLWALSPWSSRGYRNRGEWHRVRGLASVRRVVRESAGAIILRSGDAASGMTYPDSARKAVSQAGLAHIPGTLIEIDLAPSANSEGSALEPFSPSRRGMSATVVEPRRISTGSFDKGFLLRALRADSRRMSEAHDANVLCVLADIPTGEGPRRALFSDLLQLAEEVAEDRALVVLMCLQQAAIEIEPRLRSFDDLRLQSREVAGVPVMIIDRQGKIRWLGVDRRQSAVLSALARVPTGAIELEDLATMVSTSRAAVTDGLRRLSIWAGFDHNRAWLRFSADTIDKAIRQKMLRRARALAAIRKRSHKYQSYVTPTLALLDRPSEDRQIIADLGGDLLAGYILGRHARVLLKKELGQILPIDDLSIAYIGQLSPRALASFRAALGVGEASISLSGEAGLYDDPEVPFVRAGGKYILVTSMLITAERLRHAANDLVRAGAEPIGIVCICDGRAKAEPLTVLGNPLSVISVVRSNVTVAGSYSGAVAIDPVTIPRGSRNLPEPSNYPISREAILHWCEATPGALLIGHIARHSRRHFYSFLDPGPLLAKTTVREEISRVSIQLISNWLTRATSEHSISSAAIFYVEHVHRVAGDLAQLVAATISGDHEDIRLQGVYGLRHAPVAGRSVVLPPDTYLPPGTAVLVVDWGSVTLHTIQGLITAAGQAGAEAVLALVLTSQLDHLDELSARGIRAVTGYPFPPHGPSPYDHGSTHDPELFLDQPLQRTIPAEIQFMSSFPVGYSSVWECIPCRYSREYAEVSRRVSSELLERHAMGVAQRLEPRDLGEYRRDGPRDALGMPLSPSEVTQLMRLRGRLEDARLSTTARLELRESIAGMSADSLDAFVRLLMVEPRLLKRAPMRHKNLRQALQSRLATRLASTGLEAMETALRRQYLTIIRAIDKKDYVYHFTEWLVESVRQRDDITVALDLLIGIQTLVSRTYHRSPRDAQMAERALSGALDRIRNDPMLMSETQTLSVILTLSELLARTRYTSLTAASGPSAQDAWANLRQNYYTPIMNHTIDARMSAVQVAVQLDRERSAEMWQSTLEAWQTTQDFLTQRVLPLLPSVKDIILARMYDRGSAEDIERWRIACTREVLDELQKITSLLLRFVDNPKFALARKDEARRLVGWWHRVFFAKPSVGLKSEGSGLLAALSDCPCVLKGAIDEAVQVGIEIAETWRRQIAGIDVTGKTSYEVFCNKRLVAAMLRHLFENALDKRHSIDPAMLQPISVWIDISSTEHDVTIRMTNNGTQARDPIGNGMAYFDQYVRNYGGSLTGGPVTSDAGWSYEAKLIVQKYEPTYAVADAWRDL